MSRYWEADDDCELPLDRFWAVTHPHRNTQSPQYRSDAPKERALVIIHCGVPQELCHIGKDLQWLLDESGDNLTDYLAEEIDLPDGVYIWEGEVSTDCYEDYWSGGYESDSHANGEFRLATKEEWKAWVSGEYPWDPYLWLSREVVEPEPEPPSPAPINLSALLNVSAPEK